jgi:hypothetical protein
MLKCHHCGADPTPENFFKMKCGSLYRYYDQSFKRTDLCHERQARQAALAHLEESEAFNATLMGELEDLIK